MRLLQAVHCSKQILAHVNQAVKESENEHRLGEHQKKTNRSAFEKVKACIVQAYHRKSRVPLRKRSDPNIPRSKSDAEVDEKNVSDLNNSGSSSNSSLSTSLDSPSNSLEMVHKTPGGTPAGSVPGFVPSTGPLPSSGSSLSSHVHQFDDSDLEAENNLPRWQENVNINVLHLMKPEEKKRQDVINARGRSPGRWLLSCC
ncbi:uncharacterized protein LOC143235572 isoform X1 [Tachypleus tridentatus]|uniref:uncharacterized protein LOC143235572 isoform X1 n=1 Tax=Tachypleus tridentatus TaxID=6853 RepID=UPI003FD16168